MTGTWRLEMDAGFAQGISKVLAAAGVTSVEILELVRPHAFLGREVSEAARALARSARAEYQERGYGFWECILTGAVKSDVATRRGILSHATAHGTAPVARDRMSIATFMEALQNGAFAHLPARQVASLCSRVEIRGSTTEMHIPMIDFALKSGSRNDAAIVDLAVSLGLHGTIFDSGRSYHFYGAQALIASELPRFLAKAQLLGPLVDHRWASHQILDGECSLRVSTDRERHAISHRLVASSL